MSSDSEGAKQRQARRKRIKHNKHVVTLAKRMKALNPCGLMLPPRVPGKHKALPKAAREPKCQGTVTVEKQTGPSVELTPGPVSGESQVPAGANPDETLPEGRPGAERQRMSPKGTLAKEGAVDERRKPNDPADSDAKAEPDSHARTSTERPRTPPPAEKAKATAKAAPRKRDDPAETLALAKSRPEKSKAERPKTTRGKGETTPDTGTTHTRGYRTDNEVPVQPRRKRKAKAQKPQSYSDGEAKAPQSGADAPPLGRHPDRVRETEREPCDPSEDGEWQLVARRGRKDKKRRERVVRRIPSSSSSDAESYVSASPVSTPAPKAKGKRKRIRRRKPSQSEAAKVAKQGGPVAKDTAPTNGEVQTIHQLAGKLVAILKVVERAAAPGALESKTNLQAFKEELQGNLSEWVLTQASLVGRIEHLMEELARKEAAPVVPPMSFAQAVVAPPKITPGRQTMISTAQTEKRQLFIKSKAEETGAQLRKRFTTLVKPDKDGVRIAQVRTAGQTLVVEVASEADRQKLLKNKSLTTALKCEMPHRRKPEVVIYNVPTAYDHETVAKLVKAQNDLGGLSDAEFRAQFLPKFRTGPRGRQRSHLVVEVSPEMRVAILRQRRLYMGFESMPVDDYLAVIQCTRCMDLGHTQKACKQAPDRITCGHCGADGHKKKECGRKGEPAVCIPCRKRGKPCSKPGKDCEFYKMLLERRIRGTDYGTPNRRTSGPTPTPRTAADVSDSESERNTRLGARKESRQLQTAMHRGTPKTASPSL